MFHIGPMFFSPRNSQVRNVDIQRPENSELGRGQKRCNKVQQFDIDQFSANKYRSDEGTGPHENSFAHPGKMSTWKKSFSK